MKQTFLNCLLALSISVLPSYLKADTVTILSDLWYPINGQPNSSHPGYMIEIAQEILQPHGHQLDYRLAPWKRSILEVRKGNADCIIGAYKSDAPDFIFPQQAWGQAEFNFYSKLGTQWKYQGIETLNDIRLGVITGYAYSQELDQYIEKHKGSERIQVMSGESALVQNIRKLLANRLDAIISFDPVLMRQLKKMNLEHELVLTGTLELAQGLYIACSPNKAASRKLIELFDQGYSKLKAKGIVDKILFKYGIKEVKS